MHMARKGMSASGMALARRTVTRRWSMHRRVAEPFTTIMETVDA